MPRRASRGRRRSDKGAIALKVLLLLPVFFAMAALALDIGFLVLTRTQLQAACDSAALAGGTELSTGFGLSPTKTQEEVDAAARSLAREYAAYHRSGNLGSAYADPARDVRLGYARFDADSETWTTWWTPQGTERYNMVEVILRRNQPGSALGDGPLPYMIAPLIGFTTGSVAVIAKAALVPGNGFRITHEGGTADLLPFAYRESEWRERYEMAQSLYDGVNIASAGNYVYATARDNQGNPLYHPDGSRVLGAQDIFDNYHWNPMTYEVTSNMSDGILELNMYPEVVGKGGNTPGNAGTIDIGPGNNSSDDIRDQIINGIGQEDLDYFTQHQGSLDWTAGGVLIEEVNAEGETGISGGPIQQGMLQILGQPRAITLFSDVQGPGNNALYRLTAIKGVAIMDSRLSGNDKYIFLQPAPLLDDAVVPDIEGVIDENTTIFAPLMLIE